MITITLVSRTFFFRAVQSGITFTAIDLVCSVRKWSMHCSFGKSNPSGRSKFTFRYSLVVGSLRTGIVEVIVILLPTFSLQESRRRLKVEGNTCKNKQVYINTLLARDYQLKVRE